MSASRLEHVDNLLQRWVADEGIQTMVALVARRGVVVLHRAYGRLGPEADAPATPLDAVFELASTTKVLTATALMTLVEEGKVGLNRPVSGYIPEFQGQGKDAVLVRHLLTHTSGLRGDELAAYAKEQQGKVTIPPAPPTIHPWFHEYLSLRYACPLWKRPGEEMSYCDYNFDLAAEIIRRVSGLSMDRFAYERVFRPLGMNNSFYCLVDVPRELRIRYPVTPGYSPDAGDIARETERLWMGCGCALSSAADMAVLGQMFLNRGAYGPVRILSPATVVAMTRDQIPGVRAEFHGQVFPDAGWGLGWSMIGLKAGWSGGLHSPESYYHTGNGGTMVWVDPPNELVGVCFSASPFFSTDLDFATSNWAAKWRNDLFEDAVTATIVDP